MRITKVSVKKLFGIFDHEIPLNQDSRITIIHGPNGFGKTILLTMLNGLFNSNYRVFRQVSFEEFRVYFDYHEYLMIEKGDDEPGLSFVNVTGTNAAIVLDESAGEPVWLKEIKRGINVELIKTQRLQTEVAIEPDPAQPGATDSSRNYGLAVEDVSAKTARLVHSIRGRPKISEQDLDMFSAVLAELERLESEYPDAIAESTDSGLQDVLERLQDTFKRASGIHNQSRRLTMLAELLNGHFSFKRVFTDAESGLLVFSDNGELIPVASLSSGEQHQLVLFSKLLFDIPQNSLVLIDEPELSLHVTWQHEFLNDLKRIIDLCDFDVLLATHSPQIVHDKWDWMVDLHNPEADYSDDVAEYA